MASKLNYYEILEIYPAATQDEIENAFRLMLYKYHPDHNPDKPDWAHARTSEAVEAYKILSDPMRRKIYNFLIFATLRKTPKEVKFGLFDMAKKKKYEEACVLFKEGIDIYETNKASALLKFQQAYGTYRMADAVYNIGVFYTNTNKLSEAVRAFSEASKIEPDNMHYAKTLERLQELVRELERNR